MILRQVQLFPRCYRCGTPCHGTDEELDTWGIYYRGNGIDRATPAAIYCPACTTGGEYTEMEMRNAIGDSPQ